MRLVRAELRRLFKRRFTVWMLALVLALMGTVATVIAVENQKPGPAAVAQAEAEADRQIREIRESIERDFAECQRAQQAGGEQAQGWPEDCEQIRQWQPSREDMIDAYMPSSFEFRTGFPPMITVFAGLLGLFAFIVGASFVGAEWRSGGMTNLLLWRPRRLRVLGTKLGTLLGTLLGLGVLLGAAWTAGFWLVATFRGVTDTMTSGAWQSLALSGARAVTLVLVAGAIGFTLASLGRHTATALGAAIAAFIVGVAGVAIVGEMLRFGFWQAWMWTTYVRAWLDKSVLLRDYTAPCEVGERGECVVPELEITWQVAGPGMAAVVVLLVGAAMWQMRRRDVA